MSRGAEEQRSRGGRAFSQAAMSAMPGRDSATQRVKASGVSLVVVR